METTLIESTGITEAWCSTLEKIINTKGTNELSPLVLCITKFVENIDARKVLDKCLIENNLATTQTVADTIFPSSIYKFHNEDRHLLYEEYLDILPRIKAVQKKSNGKGTYFERLIAYNGKINQLEIIIKSLENVDRYRRSKLQASIFDPRTDHTENLYQGFPCLQHITFAKTSNNGLIMNSFYAIQYLFRRGYGNWLGLINLGKFVSNELGLELVKFNCFVGVEKLDGLTKTNAKILLANMKDKINTV